jgi:hypothetical protein
LIDLGNTGHYRLYTLGGDRDLSKCPGIFLLGHRLKSRQILLLDRHLPSSNILSLPQVPLHQLVKLGDHEVDEDHSENDTPLPSDADDLESVVGNSGNVDDGEDGQGQGKGRPEEQLVVEKVHLEDTELEMLALERMNHQEDGQGSETGGSTMEDWRDIREEVSFHIYARSPTAVLLTKLATLVVGTLITVNTQVTVSSAPDDDDELKRQRAS